MELKELLKTRQSTREFSDRQVSDETLEKICRAAILAPSAINAQPYKLYAVSGEKAHVFAKFLQANGANAWTDGCPAFIAIQSLEPTVITRGERTLTNAPFIGNDAGILTAYIALAAEDTGVQSCIVGLRNEEKIAEFLGLPKSTRFPLVIALGYKKDGYPLREKVRRDFSQTYTLIK